MLNLKYSSPEGRKFVDNLLDDISYYAYEASCMLAQEKGAFPGFDLRMLDSGFLSKPNKDGIISETVLKSTALETLRLCLLLLLELCL